MLLSAHRFFRRLQKNAERFSSNPLISDVFSGGIISRDNFGPEPGKHGHSGQEPQALCSSGAGGASAVSLSGSVISAVASGSPARFAAPAGSHAIIPRPSARVSFVCLRRPRPSDPGQPAIGSAPVKTKPRRARWPAASLDRAFARWPGGWQVGTEGWSRSRPDQGIKHLRQASSGLEPTPNSTSNAEEAHKDVHGHRQNQGLRETCQGPL